MQEKAHSDKNVFLVVDQLGLMWSRKMFVAEKTCQRICCIHFSCNLHNFDVFRLDGLMNPLVFGLEMFQTSRAMPEQHGLACGSVQCVNQRISPHLTSHFTQNVHQSPACGSSHTLSCTTLLPRCLTRSLVAVCTNVEPDGSRLAAFLRCAIFRVRASFAQSESVVSFTLVLS